MRIAVFGAGGVGGYLGAMLAQADEEVALIARGEHLEAIQENGLRVDSPKGDFVVRPWKATNEPSEVGVVDYVILGVKTWDVLGAAEAIRPMLGPQTAVMTLQNGVEAPSQVASVLGSEHVLGGVMRSTCHRVGAGHLEHLQSPSPESGLTDVTVGELNGTRSDRVQQLAQTLERAGIRTEVSEDIDAALWEKFASVPLFGMGAVTRVQLGVWRSIPAVHKLLKDATLEVLAVARARGVSLRDGLFELMMRVTDELLPEHWMASMQVDIMEGRPSELDAQTGAVVRLGAEAGVPTPVNEFIYYSLLPQEMKARGQV